MSDHTEGAELRAELKLVISHFEDYLSATISARNLSQRDRDYKNNFQWTSEEKQKLLMDDRNQAPIVNNHIKPKIEGLKGLLVQRRTDPKAFPRNQKDEKAAEAVTDGLRYVNDNTDMDTVESNVADDFFTEGTGSAIIEIKNTAHGKEIEVNWIPWDRYYYDPHSRFLDFNDKQYDGIVIWMDASVAGRLFKLEANEIAGLLIESSDETFEDRPRWIDGKRKRIRVCQHFYLKDGTWKMCYFTSTRFLIEPKDSPYLDEDGVPRNPIESQSAYIDRDNNRFGEVRYLIDLQDEINHRHSKYLHLLSVRQTMSRQGAIDDIPALKRELAKPDGHVEYKGDKGDFDILPTGDMADAQFKLLQEAKDQIGAKSFSAPLAGTSKADLSGKAEQLRQQAATTELASLYAGLAAWKRRIYRQIWMRIKQFWDREKWIRVTDDTTKLRWVGLNQQITLTDLLNEKMQDESLPLIERKQAAAQFQQMLQSQDPRLEQLVDVKNDVTELDLDIIIEQSLDTVNIQNEQFELVAKIMQTRPDEIPLGVLLKLSSLRDKDKIIKEIEEGQKAAQQASQERNQLEMQKEQATTAEKQAKAGKIKAEELQTNVQTQLILETPPDDTGVVI